MELLRAKWSQYMVYHVLISVCTQGHLEKNRQRRISKAQYKITINLSCFFPKMCLLLGIIFRHASGVAIGMVMSVNWLLVPLLKYLNDYWMEIVYFTSSSADMSFLYFIIFMSPQFCLDCHVFVLFTDICGAQKINPDFLYTLNFNLCNAIF